jgi:ATP-dependent RNA helicase RhlE
MSFQSLGLLPELVRAVEELGYTTPTPIQQQAIPTVLAGSDVMALAQTGTGKTAGFALPLLHRLHQTQTVDNKGTLRALILAPTRELADQIAKNISEYSKYLSFKSEVIYGGVNVNPQINRLRRGADIIIATPGRLLDLINQKVVNLSKIEMFILDEADRMLDLGFIWDIKNIIALLPKQRQNLLFSATLPEKIQSLAEGLLRAPKLIEVAKRNMATESVSQTIYVVDKKRKRELLSYMIGFHNWQQVLVFTRTKHGANHLCEQLVADGLSAAAIHGNKSQGARVRALQDFKTGAIRVLVATDIAARGIDIDLLPHVVNFELPNIPEDYVHRIGRTGRAGAVGAAISLVCVDELHLLKDIERVTKRSLPREIVPGYEPDASIKAEPIQNGRRNAGDNNRNSVTNNAARKSISSNGDRRSTPTVERRAAPTGEHRPYNADRRPASTDDRRAAPTGERRPYNADRRPASTDDRRAAPTGERRPYNADRRPASTDDRHAAPTGERRPYNADRRPASTDDRRSAPTGERRPYNGDRRPASTDDRRSAPTGDRRPSFSGDRRPASTEDRRAAPTGERRPYNGDRRPASTDDRRSAPTGDRRPSFNGDRRPASTGERRPSFSGDRRPASTDDRRSAPAGNRRPAASGDRRASTSRGNGSYRASDTKSR